MKLMHAIQWESRGRIIPLLLLVLAVIAQDGFALGQPRYVEEKPAGNSFALVGENAANLLVDTNDWAGVVRAAGDLRADIGRVTGRTPHILSERGADIENVVIVGTIGKSRFIDQLILEKKIDVSDMAGKWESFLLQVVPQPLPGVENALVICGSDKRGTIYGIYDLSEQIGVSPWYWWADVTPDHKDALFVKVGRFVQGPPSVKYRGIFLNDEAPALTGWIQAKYGNAPGLDGKPIPGNPANYGRQFYTNLFELILRIKGNYLWPAMWNNAFNEDDPENPRLADAYGIVMGTTHQEPMLRAQKEWDRRYQRQYGSWNYAKYPKLIESFWREGIRRNKPYESILTIGLRGANDTPMAPGGPEANKALLENIVEVQQKMIAEEINPDVTKVPQVWCLYKEVMDYYNAGMRVPEDVTLLWAEDNWGNVRRLPTADERRRSGGAGVYYHFDYHGGPRSYQWLNTSPIPKIWDQMSLSKQYGADRVWIVNVGHFKGYEFPLEYFMHLAWDADRWTNENLNEYTHLWAEREFGPTHAKDIAEIVSQYARFNGRRKPELLEAGTYSLVNYQEAETVVANYDAVVARAEEIFAKLPESKRDAFYQLALFPTKACAQLNELYLAANKNALYAKQGRASANDFAAQTRSLFQAQTNLMDYFNRTFVGGKWNHFMDQAHLGYTNWADPPRNNMAAITLTKIAVPDAAAMGIAIAGSTSAWPGETHAPALPQFDAFNQQRQYIDVFNKGMAPFTFTARADSPWIILSETNGTVGKDKRLWVSVNWSNAPKGTATGIVKLTGAGSDVTVKVEAFNPTEVTRDTLQGFVEGEGFVAIEAEHYTRKTDAGANRWIKIEGYGHTLSAMRTTSPVDVSTTPGKDSPCLEYRMHLFHTGPLEVEATVGPTLNFVPGRGLQLAMSFDDQPPQVVDIVAANTNARDSNNSWEESVKNNCRRVKTTHTLDKPGDHTLKIWMVDPAVALQRIVVNTGGVRPSYLGPPESFLGVSPHY